MKKKSLAPIPSLIDLQAAYHRSVDGDEHPTLAYSVNADGVFSYHVDANMAARLRKELGRPLYEDECPSLGVTGNPLRE